MSEDNLIPVERLPKRTGLFTNYIYKTIPLAFDESMSYYETLCGLLYYLKNTVKPVIDNNAIALEELQYYVVHYFDNLDIQEEIDNKLDEMAESGELEEIISTYLNSNSMLCFNTIDDLKQADNLISGSYARTLGYYDINDNGGAIYKISDTSNNDFWEETTDSNLYAQMIIENNTINVRQVGIKEDGQTDGTDLFSSLLTFATNHKYKIYGNVTESSTHNNETQSIIDSSIVLTSTLEIPIPSFIRNCAFTPSDSGIYTDNYLVTINKNGSKPPYTGTYIADIRNCFFYNNSNKTTLHCIYNYSNILFEYNYITHFDISFKNSPNYMDSQCFNYNTVAQKPGSQEQYTYYAQYLGDACSFNNNLFHLGGLYIQSASKSFIINNNISNGDMYIKGGSIVLNGSHIEGKDRQIYIDNDTSVTINNLFKYHVEMTRPDINIRARCFVNLNNCNFTRNTLESGLSDSENNVQFLAGSCNVKITNCRNTLYNDTGCSTGLIINGKKCETDYEIYSNLYEKMYHNNVSLTSGKGEYMSLDAHSVGATTIDTWKGNVGTYYYLVVGLSNPETKITWNRNVSTFSETISSLKQVVNLTYYKGGFFATIYRGTVNGTYNRKIDIYVANTASGSALKDNYDSLNGIPWETIEDTAISSSNFNVYTNGSLVSQVSLDVNKQLITAPSLPTNGTFKVGDICTVGSNLYIYSSGSWIKANST